MPTGNLLQRSGHEHHSAEENSAHSTNSRNGPAGIEKAKLEQFTGRVMEDLAATYSGVPVRLGHRLGLYKVLAQSGPLTSQELANKTGTLERYVREWLNHQLASGYLEFDAATNRYSLPLEHGMVLAEATSPVFLISAFDIAWSLWHDEDLLFEAFRAGKGVSWGDHHPRLFCGVEGFFRKAYETHLTSTWIPALDGIEAHLRSGARVADIGCGHGASTILMAQAYPASEFVGFDVHEDSIRVARERAKEQGLERQVRFEVASASDYPGSGYDFACFMDSFHDLGDPVQAARHTKAALADGGTLMLVEPFAEPRPEHNRGPVARMYYAASMMLCVPNAISQSGTLALGAQAGPLRLEEALRSGGFGRVRVAASNPFNLVLEARA